jgi:RNA polymerase sigma factor (sigma-70 family)
MSRRALMEPREQTAGWEHNQGILRKLEAGEPETVDEWLRRFAAYIRKKWSLVAHQAEDLAKDALLTAIERLEEFSGEVPIEGWLYGFAKNTARHAVRSYQRQHGEETISLEELKLQAAPPSEQEFSEGLVRALYIREKLASLEPEQQLLIRRRYYEGHSWVEIAAELETSENAVQNRHQRILKRLGEWIEADEPWLKERRRK